MDLQEAFDAGFVAVKAYVDEALAVQLRTIPDLVKAAVSEAVAALPERKDGAPGADGRDGRDADPVSDAQIALAVETYLAANPPRDGKDGAPGTDGRDGAQGAEGAPGRDGVDGKDGADGAPGRDGQDGATGKDAEPITREQLVEVVLSMPDVLGEAVQRHLQTNPPAPGRDGMDGKDGADGRDGEKGLDGRDGRDGCDATEAMIDRDGNLVVVFSDGRSKALGQVVGRDGRDGAKGDAGRDGLSLTDFDTQLSEDGRTLMFTLESEAVKVSHELQLPTMIYRGGYKEGVTYLEGDTVTFGGSLWCCSAETTDKPVEGRDCWRLAARKGRDGKDAKP